MQSELLLENEKNSMESLRGLISRGVFTATREELDDIVLSEHEAKIEGLARFVLAKKTKEERRKFLDEFEVKHGLKMADELRMRVLEISRLRKSAPDKSG